jgi:hypothetical protein
MLGYGMIQAWERRAWVVWISRSTSVLGLILTSPFRSLTLRSCGGKHGSC